MLSQLYYLLLAMLNLWVFMSGPFGWPGMIWAMIALALNLTAIAAMSSQQFGAEFVPQRAIRSRLRATAGEFVAWALIMALLRAAI